MFWLDVCWLCGQGKPDCLKSVTIVPTGVLESLTRDEAKQLIVGYGGYVWVSLTRACA